MPRLDNSSPETWEVMKDNSFDPMWSDLTEDSYVPGEVIPVDVCLYCYGTEGFCDCVEIDHPDYEDDSYYCLVCGLLLGTVDNEGDW